MELNHTTGSHPIFERNLLLIKKIKQHQKNKNFHPLTCGNDSQHKLLYPIEENNEVVLKCKNCDYGQIVSEDLGILIININSEKQK